MTCSHGRTRGRHRHRAVGSGEIANGTPWACALRDSYEAPIYTTQDHLSINYSFDLASHPLDSTCHRSSIPCSPCSGDAPSCPHLQVYATGCNSIVHFKRCSSSLKTPHRMEPTAAHYSRLTAMPDRPGSTHDLGDAGGPCAADRQCAYD
jgi:hypothetical protein